MRFHLRASCFVAGCADPSGQSSALLLRWPTPTTLSSSSENGKKTETRKETNSCLGQPCCSRLGRPDRVPPSWAAVSATRVRKMEFQLTSWAWREAMQTSSYKGILRATLGPERAQSGEMGPGSGVSASPRFVSDATEAQQVHLYGLPTPRTLGPGSTRVQANRLPLGRTMHHTERIATSIKL